MTTRLLIVVKKMLGNCSKLLVLKSLFLFGKVVMAIQMKKLLSVIVISLSLSANPVLAQTTGIPPQLDTKAKQVLEMLRKLESIVEVGVTRSEYSAAIAKLKALYNDFQSEPDSWNLPNSYWLASAVEQYTSALDGWKTNEFAPELQPTRQQMQQIDWDMAISHTNMFEQFYKSCQLSPKTDFCQMNTLQKVCETDPSSSVCQL